MTTFISYSRVNSAFVVRLAKDLKSAGFDVWLDQLDIPKGARWDDEIEAAVERASTFMIVLAPESIESQNVKDELSYAIDAGKHILPVVIQPCKIPLRLRRFQYVNFTDKPYKDSLADIKHLLSNTMQIPKAEEEKPIYEQEDPVPVVKGPLIHHRRHHEPVSEPEPEHFIPGEPQEAGVDRFRKFLMPVALAVVALAAVTVVAVFAKNRGAAPAVADSTFTGNPPSMTPTSTGLPPPPAQIVDNQGVTMRLVSGGNFIMGSDSGLPDEKPVETLYVDPFYIDKYEVTNALYRACVEAGSCQPPKKGNLNTRVGYFTKSDFDNYPVVNVDWNMAKTYCEWRGAQLPTEAEWEKAARGPDGRTYPWGEDISCDDANYFGCKGGTTSVSSYEKGMSVYGVYDMAGNVYEWVSSLYMPYPYNSIDGREDLNAAGERVVRGGSWINSDSDNEVRSSRRQRANPTISSDNIGFRCVRTSNDPALENILPTWTPENGLTATSQIATSHVRRTREPGIFIDTPVPSTPEPSTIVTPNLIPITGPQTGVPTDVTLAPTDVTQAPTNVTQAPTDVTQAPTLEPPTSEPPTLEPPTSEPPTLEPPTSEPPTSEPPTSEPPPATQAPVVP